MKQIKYFFLLVMAMMSLTSYAEVDATGVWDVTVTDGKAAIKPVDATQTSFTFTQTVTVGEGEEAVEYPVAEVDLSETSITALANEAFKGFTDLESVKLPSTVTSIGQYAFSKSGIKTMDLSGIGATTLGDRVFEECKSLESVKLPASLTTIPMALCYNCIKLSEVNFGDLENLTSIANKAFQSTVLAEADLSKTQVTSIGMYAFQQSSPYYKRLKTVKLPSTLTEIKRSAFDGCGIELLDMSELDAVPAAATTMSSSNVVSLTNYEVHVSGLEMYNEFRAATNWSGLAEANYVFPIKVKITDAKYATFCSPRDLDFTDSDVKAYIATGFNVSKSTVKIATVTSVPKGVGILLNCETAGEYEIEQKATSGEFANFFDGTLENKTLAQVDGDNTNLVLSKKNGVVGFYKAKDGMTLGINKAYLPIPTDVLESFGETECVTFSFEGETDGIEMNEVNVADGAYYTLQGVKVNEPTQKGVYIYNGKKIMVK